MVSANDALKRLREGNLRFVTNLRSSEGFHTTTKHAQLNAEQEPFAVILGCSDSRVPAELVFDQGFGDLFVIRIAGNIVAPSQIGSVEFAVERFGTRLVVVLGHSRCGAVLATLEEIRNPGSSHSANLRSIVELVRPSVFPLMNSALGYDEATLINEAVRANVRASVQDLQTGSPILEHMIENDGLTIIGAEYSLESGEVKFLD